MNIHSAAERSVTHRWWPVPIHPPQFRGVWGPSTMDSARRMPAAPSDRAYAAERINAVARSYAARRDAGSSPAVSTGHRHRRTEAAGRASGDRGAVLGRGRIDDDKFG